MHPFKGLFQIANPKVAVTAILVQDSLHRAPNLASNFKESYVGVNWFRFSCSPTSSNQIYKTKLMLHQQIYDETYANIISKIGPTMIQLWLSEVHVCQFLNYIRRLSQLCSLLSVEYLVRFEDIVQSLLDMCRYDVCSLILTKPNTNQCQGFDQEIKPLKAHLHGVILKLLNFLFVMSKIVHVPRTPNSACCS